jgi:hypothetical protein
MNLEENRDFLAVEEYAKATLERGMDGAYIANLDELFEFAMLLKRRWERQNSLVKHLPAKIAENSSAGAAWRE